MSASAQPNPMQPEPLCPHCKAELAVLATFEWNQGLFTLLCIYCPECRAALHFQALPNIAAALQGESSRIVPPH